MNTILYSPEGKILQLEYMQKKITQGPTITAIMCKDGLVIFTEKQNENVKKHQEICSKMVFLNKVNVLAGTGLFQDFSRVIERAKVDSDAFRENFSSVLVGKILASRIASLIHLQTRYWYIRPLCCSLFLGSINLKVPELFLVTCTGHYFKCFSGSLGQKSEIFRINIDKFLNKSITCRESFEKIYKLYKQTKKNFNYKYLQISYFSNENPSFRTLLSNNLVLEVDRRINLL